MELLLPVEGAEATHNHLTSLEEQSGRSGAGWGSVWGELHAYDIDPKNEALLPNFFEEFERIAKAAGIRENDEQMKKSVLGYLDAKTMHLWKALDTFDDITKTWEEFKLEILEYYPGALGTAEVATEELLRVVETFQKKGISTTLDLTEYHREFTVVAKALRTQGTLSDILIAQHYISPFPESIHARIDTGLHVYYPTKNTRSTKYKK
ncbi:MAG: hypothetical protein NXY57DRAFT_965970 [Lentinula lateritia]|nr:MAG: hypothetical protein NXY57DRAFT_965970 [Lentinula lateritia]